MPILVYFSKFYLHIVNYLIKIYFARHFVAQAEKSLIRTQPLLSIPHAYPLLKRKCLSMQLFCAVLLLFLRIRGIIMLL